MTKVQTADQEFNAFLETQGYIDPEGVLTVSLREAKAIFYLEDIQQRKKNIRQDFIGIARSLWSVYRFQLWIELGYDNFVEFLYSPEIDFRKSLGYALKDCGMLLEEGIITEDDMRGIDPSKIRALLPLLKDGDEDEESRAEWLERAKILSTLDLEDEIRGREILRFRRTGMLEDILKDLSEEDAFWESQVALFIKTC